MLDTYARLFAALESHGIDHAVWKNLDEVPDALEGRGDIDLYVPLASRSRFLEQLHAHGFVRVDTHKAYPCTEHHYGFDAPSGAFCHLHCYFRIVTGESHIKQYVVPIEPWLDSLPFTRGPSGVRELHPRLLSALDLFRRRIKLSCLIGALLFHRERAGYRRERALLDARLAGASGGPVTGGWPDALSRPASLPGEIVAGWRCRHRFRRWNRFAPMTTPLHRYGALGTRVLGKWRRRRKTLPTGLLIAITDAARPSVAHALSAWLGEVFGIRSLSLRGDGRAVVRALAQGSVVICTSPHREPRDGASDRTAPCASLPWPDIVLCTEAERAGARRSDSRWIAVDDGNEWRERLWNEALATRSHREDDRR